MTIGVDRRQQQRFLFRGASCVELLWYCKFRHPSSLSYEVEHNFAASLKNCHHQLINSMNVELGNNSVVRLEKMNSILEQQLGLVKMRYLGVENATGLGEVNTIIAMIAFTPTDGYGAPGYLQNQGRLNGMINSTSYDVAMETSENLAQVIASGKIFLRETI